jgi:K(+)-stimulated pyrophosphate-energized sodium pump
LLAVELAVTLTAQRAGLSHVLALAFFLASFFFVYKSFYGMRIGADRTKVPAAVAAD